MELISHVLDIGKKDYEGLICSLLLKSNAMTERGDFVGRPYHLIVEALPDLQ